MEQGAFVTISQNDVIEISGGVKGFAGSVAPPGDKSISHRALLFAALADGESVIRGLSGGKDVGATLTTVRSLGADALQTHGDTLVVNSRGRGFFREPPGVIDVGNSGTLMRLVCGYLAGQPGHYVVAGDASVNSRPMARVTVPLKMMGASIDGRGDGGYPPISIRGRELNSITYRTPVPSAQIKSAILLAGLSARGTTTVCEEVVTRPHTEEFLAITRVPYAAEVAEDGQNCVSVSMATSLACFDVMIPKDPSQCAFWAVAAVISEMSTLHISDMYAGDTRTGFVMVLQRMGAGVEIVDGTPTVEAFPVGTLRVRSSSLRATVVEGSEISSLIDEIPILAVAACFAEGTTEFRGIAELRVKESDRIANTVAMLEAFGAEVTSGGDWLKVHGRPGFIPRGCVVDALNDHRIAMSAAVMASVGAGVSKIKGFESVETSYPDFLADLASLSIR